METTLGFGNGDQGPAFFSTQQTKGVFWGKRRGKTESGRIGPNNVGNEVTRKRNQEGEGGNTEGK